MLLRAIKAEVLKCRRAPVWLAFLVLPVFPAVLGTFNYLGNLGVLEDQWYSLWSQHTLFSSMFFLPALFGVFCAWQWRLEHTDHNWNAVLTAPVPAGTLYLAKLAVDAAVSLLAMAFIGVLFVLSGKLAGITAPLPPELPRWLLLGALGGVVVCAVQLFFSLTAFPYSLLALGMAANNPRMELPLPSFLTGCAGYLVLAAVLSIRWLSRRDASTA